MAYIYKHIRKDNGEVFYVGLSLKNDPKHGRAYSKDSRRSNHWKNIVKSVGYKVEIIEDNLTPDEAKEKEKYYISLYGRKDLGLGTLCNFTDGGDGTLGHRHTEEWKKNASERMKGELNSIHKKVFTDEDRIKMSESRRGRKHSEETLNKLRGRKHSEETLNKMRGRKGELNPNYGKCGELSASWGRKATKEEREHLSKVRKGRPALNKLKVIDIITKKVYSCGAEAISDLGLNISITHLGAMLRGKYDNWTSLIKLDDYNNTNDISELKFGSNNNPNEKIIFDRITGIFFNSAKDAHDFLNFKFSVSHFNAMLTGKYTNKTSCTYV